MNKPNTPNQQSPETNEQHLPTQETPKAPDPDTPNPQPSEENRFQSLLDVLTFLFKTKQGLFIFFGLLVVLATIAIAAIMHSDKVEISTGVGTIIVKNGNKQNSVFLLSPTGSDDTPWVKTGIKVKKGDKIKITASGRVHTSLKRLVAEAQNHQAVGSTYLPWVGPEGLLASQDLRLQSIRSSYKVLPDKDGAYNGYGKLLAAVKNARSQIVRDNIEPIGESREFKVKDDGDLMLTVNDIWLNDGMKDIFVLPFDKNFEYYKSEAYFQAMLTGENVSVWSKDTEKQKAREEYRKRQRSWDAIVKNRAWSIWYEDNTGSFSVAITVNP